MFINIKKYIKIYKIESHILIYNYMKAKEVMKKYDITRNTLSNWVKRGWIKVEKMPSGRYIYNDKIDIKNEKIE